jgi:hypothetical protein
MIHILNSKKKNANESKLIKKLELIYIYIYELSKKYDDPFTFQIKSTGLPSAKYIDRFGPVTRSIEFGSHPT